jgi:hypothetical protein
MDVSGCKVQEAVLAKVPSMKEFTGGLLHSLQIFLTTDKRSGIKGQRSYYFITVTVTEQVKGGYVKECNLQFRCKTSGFHGSDYEEWCLLGCYAVWLL